MERLTFKYNGQRNAFYRRENGNSIVDVPPGSIIASEIQDVLNKLSTYEDAEEQGLLIKLPCKVGDTCYEIIRGEIVEHHFIKADFPFLHKIYSSREEAEDALAKDISVTSKGENNG